MDSGQYEHHQSACLHQSADINSSHVNEPTLGTLDPSLDNRKLQIIVGKGGLATFYKKSVKVF